MDLTDLTTLTELLRFHNIHPDKSKGQNFLVDREVLDKIIEAADLKPDDLVLEVGPGIGVLTKELARRVKKVLVVELDEKLIKILEQTLKEFKNVEILAGDILKIKNEEFRKKLGRDYKLVANLPYNITGQIFKKFLTYQPKPKEMTLMLQKEVAERITAPAGKMSRLAVAVQLYGRPALWSGVKKDSFYPAPKVDSAIVKIRNINSQVLAGLGIAEKDFWRLVKIGFSSRRKQLQNNLAVGLKLNKEEVKNVLIKANFDPKIRAQELLVDDWIKLAKFF